MMLRKNQPRRSVLLLLLSTLLLGLVIFPTVAVAEGRRVRRGLSAIRGIRRQLQEDEEDADAGEDTDADADVEVEGEVEVVPEPEATDGSGSSNTIVDIASSQDNLKTLVTGLSAAGLLETLGAADASYTVFAPTDEAFVNAEIDFLLDPEWILHLEAVLLYHVAEGLISTDDFEAGQQIPSIFENEPINVTSAVEPYSVNDAQIVQANVAASNGIVHVIEEVLFPEFTEVTITELMEGIPDQFSTLVGLLESANLTDTLGDDEGVYTVFAPNNDAFAKLDAATLELLGSEDGAELLEDILLYHVVPGIAYATGVEVGDTAETLEESNITVTNVDPTLVINGVANVTMGDILTVNGVIHIVDTVLMPPTDEDEDEDEDPDEAPPPEVVGELDLESWVFLGENYSTLYTLLNATGLTEALSGPGPLTLFAPDDDAFDAVPNAEKYLEPEWYAHLYDILLYHVVPGARETVNLTLDSNLLTGVGENITVTAVEPSVVINNSSSVVNPDNVVSNGVAHGVDQVLLPPSAVYDIVDVVEASPYFAQLLGLLMTAGMEDALGGPGPFTLFAPTNNAITLLDQETSSILQSPDGLPQLQSALQYHVVPGIILSDDVSPGQMFETLHGCMLTLSQGGDNGNFFINDARILDADILASNGVIHVIDSVLLPSDDCETVAPVAADATEPVSETTTNGPTAAPLPAEPEAEAVPPTAAPIEEANPEPAEPTEEEVVEDVAEEVEEEVETTNSTETTSNTTDSTDTTDAPQEEAEPDTPITDSSDGSGDEPTSGAALRRVVVSMGSLILLPFLILFA